MSAIRLVALTTLCAIQSLSAQRATTRSADIVFEASITDLQSAMTSGRVTAVALVDAYLARIAAYDHQGPALNAMIRLNPQARTQAAVLDAERRAGKVRGPLHGIPVILKDNYATRDLPTSAGSIALAGLQTPDDAFQVRKLREAGAVILGKSNMHELASGITNIRAEAAAPRSPPATRRSRSDRTPAVRSAFRRRCTTCSACVPPRDCRALMESSRSRTPRTSPARWRAP
jgi:hypothetical protein